MATNGAERIELIEQRLQIVERDMKALLYAQVLHRGQLDTHDIALTRLEKAMDRTDERLKELGEATDARIAALTSAIGAYIGEMHERDKRREH